MTPLVPKVKRIVRCAICNKGIHKFEDNVPVNLGRKKRLAHNTCYDGAYNILQTLITDENEMLHQEARLLKEKLVNKPCRYKKIADAKPTVFDEYLCKLRNGRHAICIFEPWSSRWIDHTGYEAIVSEWMKIPE